MAGQLAALTEHEDQLRREERLLVEGLGAAEGRQRGVQQRLLKDTRQRLVLAGRARRAVEAGWEPFEPSPEWRRGYIEDPRFLNGHSRLVAIPLALPLATGLGVALALTADTLAAVATAAIAALGCQTALHELLGRLAARRDKALGNGNVLLFNAPMPAHATTAYRRARDSHLFDTFVVCSPRAEDFCAVSKAEAPSLGLLDPVLLGLIGDQAFLVAQWDLAADLLALG